MSKKIRFTLVLVLVVVAAPLLAQEGEAEGIDRYTQPEALVELVEQGEREFVVVDVRTPAEYRSGHIPGAVNIDHRRIGENPPAVSKDALVVTYCRSGARASRAQATLERMGFENVVNFGGVSSWPKELVTGDEPR